MKNQKWLIFVFVVLCLSIWSLDAKKIVIDKNELTKTIKCQGDEVIVSGNENELTIKGECSRLYVPGNKNIIDVEAVAVIDTPGTKNTVTWEKGIDDKKPSISNLGTENKIKKAAPDEEAEEEEEEEDDSKSADDMGISKTVDNALSKLDILGKGKTGSTSQSSGDNNVIEITGNREVKTLKLKGEKLIITGNFNKLKVKGTCSELLVRGNANVVEIAAVGIIKALGNLNKVYWEKGLDDENPSISNVGTNNEISQVEE
jgi:lipopolysaccharide export system protein LptA